MVDARAARLALEALGQARSWVAVTRQGMQVVLPVFGANVDADARATRLVVEALAESPAWVSVTRQGMQAALAHPGARTDLTASTTRLSLEALAEAEEWVSVTRQGMQVALAPLGANPAAVARTTRYTMEVLARAFTPITPFTPPEGWQFFVHNWAEGATIESSYETDITDSAEEIAEERTALIQKPRRTVTVSWIVKGNLQAAEMMTEFRRLTKENSAVPIYPDMVHMETAATAGQNYVLGDFSKGRFLSGVPVVVANVPIYVDPLGGPHVTAFEVRTIQARLGDRIQFVGVLENSYPAHKTVVIPLLQTHPLVEVEYNLLTDNTIQISATFDEIYGPSSISELATGITTQDHYGGYPILSVGIDWTGGVKHGIRREGESTTLGRGRVVYQRGARGRQIKELVFTEERDIAWDLLRFFDSRRGRLLPFWLIDLDNVYTVPLVSPGKVSVSQLGSFEAFQDELEYFGLLFADGRVVVRQATAIQEVGGVWELFPDTNITGGYTAADVVGFGRARLCRKDSDALEEQWTTTNVCSMTVPVIELLAEEEVL